MTDRPTLDDIRADLEPFRDREVVVFGSWCGDWFTPRSDVDVAVVSRRRDREENKRLWISLLGRVPSRYDVRVFELLPLGIQADIVEHHEVVFGDPVGLSEYFFPVRRRWRDVAHRVRENPPLLIRERLRRRQAEAKREG